MRRVLVCAILSVLIGVFATVGVTWSLAAFLRPDGEPYPAATAGEPPLWAAAVICEKPGVTRRLVWRMDKSVSWPTAKRIDSWSRLSQPVPTSDGMYSRLEDARGWPFRAMYCWWETRDHPTSIPRVSGGIDLAPASGTGVTNYTAPRALPLTIIWPGFLANLAIYSTVAFLVLYIPGAIRRDIRFAAGACAQCGYDLSAVEHEVCPECGVAAKPAPEPTKAADAPESPAR